MKHPASKIYIWLIESERNIDIWGEGGASREGKNSKGPVGEGRNNGAKSGDPLSINSN